jgi:hypothetical protein
MTIMTIYRGTMKPERPRTYLQTMMRPRNRRIQIIQILIALAVLVALVLTRPAPTKTMSLFGGTVQPATAQFDWMSQWLSFGN